MYGAAGSFISIFTAKALSHPSEICCFESDSDQQENSQQLTQTLSSYGSPTLALYNALDEGGILLSRSWNDPTKNYEERLVKAGFQALQEYEEVSDQSVLVVFMEPH